jgi:atypical dual specificity phosphatase
MTIDHAVLMHFSWVEDHHLAACRGPRNKRDLAFLKGQGIRALVRLAYEDETGMTAPDVTSAGLRDCYEPVTDCTPPGQEQLDRVTTFINDHMALGEPVAVSCNAGYGRTGTVLACVLVTRGLAADEAIKQLIAKRPVADELLRVPGQAAAVREFATRQTPAR